MAGKDCNCGKTVEHEVALPDNLRGVAVSYVTLDWSACLAHAREVLGIGAGQGSAKELIDALCTALTVAREEKQILASALDTCGEELDECREGEADSAEDEVDEDEVDEDDWDDDTEVTNQGSDNSDGQNLQTTADVSGPTLSEALEKRATARAQLVRQDSAREQSGRGLQRSVLVLRDAGLHAPPDVRSGASVRSSGADRLPASGRDVGPTASSGQRQLPVLPEHHQLQPDQQRNASSVLARPRHSDANVRGHLLQGSTRLSRDRRVQLQHRPAMGADVPPGLRVPVAPQYSQETADAGKHTYPGVRVPRSVNTT